VEQSIERRNYEKRERQLGLRHCRHHFFDGAGGAGGSESVSRYVTTAAGTVPGDKIDILT
jgi:hypothetical protein